MSFTHLIAKSLRLSRYPISLRRLLNLWYLVLRETLALVSRKPGPRLLTKTMSGSSKRIGSPAWDTLRKLHIGGGAVYLRGYVNTDIPNDGDALVDRFEGARADVRCYLHDLSIFEDESFDVVELYHVIEHATHVEALEGLREIYRVLRPEGEVVIECPDISKCSLNLLLHHKKDEKLTDKLAMNGVYSDKRYLYKSMIHCYGYWPASLAERLEAAGFAAGRVYEIPARRYPDRDVRLVAFKGPIAEPVALARASERVTMDSVTTYQVDPTR